MASIGNAPSQTKRRLALWLAILGVALTLRIYRLGFQSLWIDECFSDLAASWSMTDLIHNQINDSSPPFYYLALGRWAAVFGRSETALRSLSALMGIGTVVSVLLLGNALLGYWPATTAGLLAATSPMMIYYSQEARMYSMVTFLSALASYFWVMSWRMRKSTYSAAFVICSILALYSQLYAYFVLAAQALSKIPTLKRTDLRYFLKLVTTPLIALTPWLIVIVRQVQHNTTPWIRDPTLQTLKDTLIYMSIKSWRLQSPSDDSLLVTSALILMISLALIGFISLISSRRQTFLLPLYWVVPSFLPLALSTVKPLFHPGRYETIAYPAFFLLVAAGIAKLAIDLRFPTFFPISVTCVVILNGLALSDYYTTFTKSNDKTVFKFIATEIPADDVIIITDVCRLCFHYYCDPTRRYHTFPTGELGWLPREAFTYDKSYFRNQWRLIIPEALKEIKSGGALWVTRNSDLPVFLWLQHSLTSVFGLPIVHYFPPGDTEVQINSIYEYRIDDRESALRRVNHLGDEED